MLTSAHGWKWPLTLTISKKKKKKNGHPERKIYFNQNKHNNNGDTYFNRPNYLSFAY